MKSQQREAGSTVEAWSHARSLSGAAAGRVLEGLFGATQAGRLAGRRGEERRCPLSKCHGPADFVPQGSAAWMSLLETPRKHWASRALRNAGEKPEEEV